jgi:hypothetical protein
MLRLELAVAQRSVIGSPEAHRTKEGLAVTVTNPTLCVQSLLTGRISRRGFIIRFLFLFLLHVTSK